MDESIPPSLLPPSPPHTPLFLPVPSPLLPPSLPTPPPRWTCFGGREDACASIRPQGHLGLRGQGGEERLHRLAGATPADAMAGTKVSAGESGDAGATDQ